MSAAVIVATYAGATEWRHEVEVGGPEVPELVTVTVRRSGMGYSMEADSTTEMAAMAAMALVAQAPQGVAK